MRRPADTLRILFDHNVLLDVLLRRDPFVREATQLWDASVRGTLSGVVASTAVTTIAYLIQRAYSAQQAHSDVQTVLQAFEIATVGRRELEAALAAGFERDYEDGVVHAAAVASGCVGVVTRDATGFAASMIPVYTPTELLAILH